MVIFAPVLEGSDVFSVNDDFTSKLTRIRIQQISNKGGETEPERKETRSKVNFFNLRICYYAFYFRLTMTVSMKSKLQLFES